MIDMAFNSSKSNSIITCIVDDIFQCTKIDWNNLSDDEKLNKSNELIQELDNLYSLLSESIHAMKKISTGSRIYNLFVSYYFFLFQKNKGIFYLAFI